jgi:hypothetical protein
VSLASRQHTCAVCAAAFLPSDDVELEVLLDDRIRYVAVHPGHSTYAPMRGRVVELRPTASVRRERPRWSRDELSRAA